MVKVFSWEYFSFLQLDSALAYKEVAIIPVVLAILLFIWMKIVSSESSTWKQTEDKTKRPIDIQEAYEDALLNEVDSQGEEGDDEDEDKEANNKKDD